MVNITFYIVLIYNVFPLKLFFKKGTRKKASTVNSMEHERVSRIINKSQIIIYFVSIYK